ncbi:MAG: roadblock/LC7 domain-containing protein [Candidatus Methanoperedenaceae archaeon]|nr:roadblock/LC7 domain-containing protein [Candidatus Methanoperedenaceae archaeon]
MATKAELYHLALEQLENSTADILSSALVTDDGLIMASTTSGEVNKETFAAYCAAAFKRVGETMEEHSSENIDTLLFESKNHRVVTVRVGEHALLVVLTGKNIQMGLILINMQKTAQKIKELSETGVFTQSPVAVEAH